jgi:hypothetical protein
MATNTAFKCDTRTDYIHLKDNFLVVAETLLMNGATKAELRKLITKEL